MFCSKCGAELVDNAKFCAKCGNPVNVESVQNEETISKQGVKKTDNNEVKYTLKPTFNYAYKIGEAISGVLFFIFIIFAYILYTFGVFGKIIANGLNGEYLFPVIIIIALVLVIYICIKLMFEKKQYDNLEYNFYANKLEYRDGFINKEEKELKYKNIREIVMSQSIFERMFSLGTIKIFTNASSGTYTGRSHNAASIRNGIMIHCVENVNEEYKKIKAIIDENAQE